MQSGCAIETVSIYGLTDPRNGYCRYVGKTKSSIHSRLKGHISDAKRHPRIRRFKWINELKENGLLPEVILLDSVADSDWQESEQFWISYLRYIGCDLLNRTGGGDGIHNFKHSEETKRKMSEAAKRTNLNPAIVKARGDGVRRAFAGDEARKALSDRLKESHARPEVREKLRACAKAKAATPEFKAWVSKAQTGKVMSAETRAKLSKARTGQKRSAESIQKSVAGRAGYRHSEATKEKMREAAYRREKVKASNA